MQNVFLLAQFFLHMHCPLLCKCTMTYFSVTSGYYKSSSIQNRYRTKKTENPDIITESKISAAAHTASVMNLVSSESFVFIGGTFQKHSSSPVFAVDRHSHCSGLRRRKVQHHHAHGSSQFPVAACYHTVA